MDAHTETRYHVHGQTQLDDTGKRSAVKAARYVWRGAFGKGQQCTSLGAYPTRKMERLFGRWSAMIAWLGNKQARQFTELYRALRLYVNCFQPRVLLLSKQLDGKKVRYVYDPAKTPLQRLLLSGALPTQKQQELTEVAQALDPIRLFQHVEGLQKAVSRCAASCSPCVSHPPSAPIRVFSVERCTTGNIPIERSVPCATAELHTLYRVQEKRKRVLGWRRARKDPFEGECKQILSWLVANPERSSGDIIWELQRLSPGRYHPLQIRTLQRGMRKIRAYPPRKPLRSSGKMK